jgi:hypothetical protein
MRTVVFLPILALFAIACTEADQLITPPDSADLSYIGYTGETGDAPPSLIADEGDVPENQWPVIPSTNADNLENGWANVTWDSDDAGIGKAPLRFTSTRGFQSCFEYRIDDQDAKDSQDNFNEYVLDGLWSYVCLNNTTGTLVMSADSHVDVRMVFGGERDERFDWTRFYVMTPLGKNDCQDGGWQAEGFKNQGQCIRYVETGKDNR